MLKNYLIALFSFVIYTTVNAKIVTNDIVVSANKQLAAISYDDKDSGDDFINIYTLADGKKRQTLKGFQRGITDIDLSRDGKHLVAADYDDNVTLWDTTTGQQLAQKKLDNINTVFFSDNSIVVMGQHELTRFDNQLKKVTEKLNKENIQKLSKKYNNDRSLMMLSTPMFELPSYKSKEMHFVKQGNIVLLYRNEKVNVLDNQQKKRLGEFKTDLGYLVFSDKDGEVWSYDYGYGQSKPIEVWDSTTQTLKSIRETSKMGEGVYDIKPLPNKATMALAVNVDGNRSKVLFIDRESHQLQGEIEPRDFFSDMTFLDDNRLFLAIDEPEIWDIKANKMLVKIKR